MKKLLKDIFGNKLFYILQIFFNISNYIRIKNKNKNKNKNVKLL